MALTGSGEKQSKGRYMMKYFEKKQIHSLLSSFSSNDVYVTRKIDRDAFLLHSGEKTVSRKYGFSVAYAEPDKRFYSSMRGVSSSVMDTYVAEAYLANGWVVDDPFLTPALRSHWADEEAARVARRKRQGYVIPAWSRDIPPKDYQGGFSDDVFFHSELFNYLESGGCHGFIGHSVRKRKLDAYLESQFLRCLDSDKGLFAMWLTSTGGRHFGDSLEGRTFAEQKAYIRKNAASLVEQAKGYAAAA
jgi:hypothetical protein